MSLKISPKVTEALKLVAKPLVFGGLGAFIIDTVNHRAVQIFPKVLDKLGTIPPYVSFALGFYPIGTTLAVHHFGKKAIPHFQHLKSRPSLSNKLVLVLSIGSGLAVAGGAAFIFSIPLIQVVFATTIGAGLTLLLPKALRTIIAEKKDHSIPLTKDEIEKIIQQKMGHVPPQPQPGQAPQPHPNGPSVNVEKQEYEAYKAGVQQNLNNLNQAVNNLPNFNEFAKVNDVQNLRGGATESATKEDLEEVRKLIKKVSIQVRKGAGAVDGKEDEDFIDLANEPLLKEDKLELIAMIEELKVSLNNFVKKDELVGNVGPEKTEKHSEEKESDSIHGVKELSAKIEDLSGSLSSFVKIDDAVAIEDLEKAVRQLQGQIDEFPKKFLPKDNTDILLLRGEIISMKQTILKFEEDFENYKRMKTVLEETSDEGKKEETTQEYSDYPEYVPFDASLNQQASLQNETTFEN